MALEIIVSEVTLDVYDHDATPDIIKAISGDSATRYVSASLTNAGDEYIPDTNATAELLALRPDKTVIIGDAECRVRSIPIHDPITPIAIEEEIDGETVTRYYYINDDGETVYVDSGDIITFPTEDVYDLYAELIEDMLSVIGTVKCQFRITTGSQVMHTSLFYINNGIDLGKDASCVIDSRSE